MDIIKYAQCGSLESCDLLVQIKPHDKGIVLELNSNVYISVFYPEFF